MNRFLHIFLAAGTAFASALILAIFAIPALSWDVTIAWDPNRELTLDGYTIYYKKYSPGPPYDYIGDVPLSTLPNPVYPSTEVTNLENGVEYFFALTAYDTDSNESAFSNYLCIRRDGQTIVDCTPAKSSGFGTNSGSGGSGGGGCFIQSAGGSTSSPNSIPILQLPFGFFIGASIILRAVLAQ